MDYTALLPTQPPEGLTEWLREQGRLKRHALIFKAAWVADPLTGEKERMAELKCSACGGKMYAGWVNGGGCIRGGAAYGYIDPVHGDPVAGGYDALCPMCGEPVKVCHAGSYRDWIPLDECYPMTVGRVEDRLVLMGWCVRHVCEMDGREQVHMMPYEAYVAEERKVVRLTGYHKCMATVRLLGRWEQRKQYADNWSKADLIYPWDPALLIGGTAEKGAGCGGSLYGGFQGPVRGVAGGI